MGTNPPPNQRSASLVRYMGDSETGLVHRVEAGGCDADAHEIFLDLRTALVRGYRLCPDCVGEPLSSARMPQSAQRPLRV